jgi:tryptophan synthase alpha subunit
MTSSRLSDIIAGNTTRGELAVGMYLVPGFPDWPTSMDALELCHTHGVDFIEFPAMSAARWSPRTGPAVERALREAAPYSEAEMTAWLLRAPVRVAVVYESAWPSPAVWSAPPLLRIGASGYLFESEPPDIEPYASAAARDGAVVIPATNATNAGLSDADVRLLSCGGGFVYASLGPKTGTKTASVADLVQKRSAIQTVRPDLPVCAAFGISRPSEIEELRAGGGCDGVIIGSAALVQLAAGTASFGAWLKDIVTSAK